jgi:hypothetical protein
MLTRFIVLFYALVRDIVDIGNLSYLVMLSLAYLIVVAKI